MPMHVKTLTTCASLTLLALASHAAAAEMNLADLRFGAGVLSNRFSGENHATATSGPGSGTTTSSSDSGRNSDHNYRGQIEFVGGHLGDGGGLIYGAGIAVNQSKFDNGSQEATATIPVVDIMLGYGYAFTPNWHFEVAPFVGAGRAYYSVTDHGDTQTSKNWDKYIEFGARVGTYFTLPGGLQFGVEVPYLIGSYSPDYSRADGTAVSDKRENRGFGLLVSVGGRF
ncbi:MAG: hypothetical protein H0X38_05780 [Planctomycetes bacterium]|nr:hypothetical protein [Planctomycetota bacterium]